MRLLYLMKGGTDYNVWDQNTIYLYFIIVFISYILGILSCKSKVVVTNLGERYRFNTINKFIYILLFLFLAFFAIFRDVGTDLPMYRDIFNNANLGAAYYNNQEPGYMALNILFNKLGFNDFAFIALISALTLFFTFKAISDNARQINIGLSVLAFASLYYLQSYSLIRIYLVASVLLYTSKYLITGQYRKYLISIICCVLFHYSAILMLLPCALCYVYEKKRAYFPVVLIFICLVAVVGVNFLTKIPVFTRYEVYLNDGLLQSSFGYMQIAFNLPNILLWFYSRNRGFSKSYMAILITFSLSALLIGILSYKVLMLGRSLVYFNIIYVICIPYVLYKIKQENRTIGIFFGFIYIIYLLLRLVLYLNEYIIVDGLMPYQFIK